MSRTPELIDRLVKYVERIRSHKNNGVTLKPLGAFKECKSFYAKLDFWDDGTFVLTIKCRNIHNHYDGLGTQVLFHKLKHNDPDNIRQSVVECLDILDNITFSVADGVFYKYDEKLPGTEFQEIMNELWGIEQEVVCCVCQEKTVNETPCGHKLCILCWSTINETKPRCPMCRAKIDYFEEEESEDSESETD